MTFNNQKQKYEGKTNEQTLNTTWKSHGKTLSILWINDSKRFFKFPWNIYGQKHVLKKTKIWCRLWQLFGCPLRCLSKGRRHLSGGTFDRGGEVAAAAQEERQTAPAHGERFLVVRNWALKGGSWNWLEMSGFCCKFLKRWSWMDFFGNFTRFGTAWLAAQVSHTHGYLSHILQAFHSTCHRPLLHLWVVYEYMEQSV